MYNPVPFGGDAKDGQAVVDWVQGELAALAASFFDLNSVRFTELNVAPTKPRTGDVVLADGTNWNPGAGAGFYGYHGGAWSKLG